MLMSSLLSWQQNIRELIFCPLSASIWLPRPFSIIIPRLLLGVVIDLQGQEKNVDPATIVIRGRNRRIVHGAFINQRRVTPTPPPCPVGGRGPLIRLVLAKTTF